MYKFLCESIFLFVLYIYLRVELPNHMLTLCLLTFWPVRLFPKRLQCFTFPSAMYEDSSFSTSSPILLLSFLVIAVLVVSECGFELHFPNYLSCWVSVHMLIDHLYFFFLFGEISSRFIAHFLVGLSFYYWVIRGLYII